MDVIGSSPVGPTTKMADQTGLFSHGTAGVTGTDRFVPVTCRSSNSQVRIQSVTGNKIAIGAAYVNGYEPNCQSFKETSPHRRELRKAAHVRRTVRLDPNQAGHYVSLDIRRYGASIDEDRPVASISPQTCSGVDGWTASSSRVISVSWAAA